MSDSDDFGDVDETDFLEVATHFERSSTPFQPSPRPQKRRRIDEDEDGIPPRQTTKRQPFVVSDSEKDDVPLVTAKKRVSGKKNGKSSSTTPRSRKGSKAGLSSTDVDVGNSTAATSTSSTVKRKRGRPRKEKDNQTPGKDEDSPTKKSAKKPKHRIHVPNRNLDLTDIFQSQVPARDSSPGALRGPIWKKPVAPPTNDVTVVRLESGQSNLTPSEPRHNSNGVLVSLNVKDPTKAREIVDSPIRPPPEEVDLSFDAAQELADLPSDAFASSSSSPQKALDEAVYISSQEAPIRTSRLVAPQNGLRQTTLFGRGPAEEVPESQANKRYNFIASQRQEPPTHHKLDDEAMKTWVYPINLGSIRDYQFNIVARGLYHNLLVALPTGLGKTFIAATIMLNWFRWTKDAQVVFLAPTKPLVSQQVEACFGIAGIPRSETTMLTGGVAPGIRAEEWSGKRVFFMTPQTMINDLKTGICDPKRIVLLVIDEAHRATGAYAYVEVVKFIRRFNESFRVLALTATPGSDVESVQKVIDGLDISRVEIRTEISLDIRSYVHQRKIEKHVFENSEEMGMCMGLYSQAVQPVLNKITAMNAYWGKDPVALTPFGLTQARAKWMASPAGKAANWGVKGMVMNIFSLLASLAHSMELLKYHGMGPFYTKLRDFQHSTDEGKSKYKREIMDSEPFRKLMVRLHTWVNNDQFIGHPKLEFLQEVILDHFVNAGEGRGPGGAPPSETRIMVFAHFRDSAEEIVQILSRHKPMIRPHVFVGQATAKNSEGMDQKMQLDVVEKFKKGHFNTLVATSIGEEGLDIGEVDLIICYDSKASPIRMLQRMGRTGRKREGKIILLQMKGKEEDDAAKAKDNYEKMQEMIANGSRFTFHDDRSRRIVPRDAQPVVDKRVVEIPLENTQDELPEPKRRNGRAPKRPPKKFHMPDNVITGFVQVSRMGDPDGGVHVAKSRAKKKAPTIHPSEEPVVLDPLETVLLTEGQTKDLERRYQTVFDDEESPMIEALNLGAFPARQRVLSKMQYFRRPGRASVSIVKMLRSMYTMNDERVAELRNNLHQSDTELPYDLVVSDASDTESGAEMLPQPYKATPKAKPRAKAAAKTTTTPARPRGRPPKNKTPATDTTTPARPRGRPPKDATPNTNTTNPAPRRTKTQPKPRAQTFRMDDDLEEAASSSPPPTDPRMRIASQAIDLGAEDTSGEEYDENDDPRLDSDLASFIADDDEEIRVFSSSLPNIDGSFGRKGRGGVTAAELFTSDDVVVPEYVVSDDGDDEEDEGVAVGRSEKALEVIVSDEDDEEPVARNRNRVRRVIEDDEDEDE